MFVSNSEDKFVDKIVQRLSQYSASRIIILGTLFVITGSVPLVYLYSLVSGMEYTFALFFVSILLPALLSPITLYVFIKLSKHLKHFRDELDKQIEKNRQQDILLFEQARFSLMGEMMANISHQWKQPLNTINLCMINSKLSENKDEYFDIIEDNVNYLSSTIDDFMSFFDNKTYSEIRELGDIIREIKSIVLTHIKNNEIDFKIEFDVDYKKIHIASSISQVMLNLINNAKDSCINEKANREILLKITDKKDHLALMCCDSGKNIDKDIKEKIFDPYFTTKAKNKGTGIGLYMSRQIVQKVFDGVIYYEEAPKCFYVELPYGEKCIKGDI
jgi:signal transduction histidine kinase